VLWTGHSGGSGGSSGGDGSGGSGGRGVGAQTVSQLRSQAGTRRSSLVWRNARSTGMRAATRRSTGAHQRRPLVSRLFTASVHPYSSLSIASAVLLHACYISVVSCRLLVRSRSPATSIRRADTISGTIGSVPRLHHGSIFRGCQEGLAEEDEEHLKGPAGHCCCFSE
jgi:hypothetical protein